MRLLPAWLAIFLSMTVAVRAAEPVVVGYLPKYRIDAVDPQRLGVVTDVVYFSFEPAIDGKLPEMLVEDQVLARLKLIKQASNCRILICAGGWNRSEGFAKFAMNPAARKTFIDGMFAYCQQHGFDGIDYDWEHPKDVAELTAYADLLSETASRFHAANMIVTVAQAGWQDIGKRAYDAIDRVHLMCYDHAFPHATLEKATADIERLLQWGCPPEKIALGVPFYGRDKDRKTKMYRELVGDKAVDPAADIIDGYAANGPATISAKLEYIRTKKLAGIMIWELGQDAIRDDASLLKVIEKLLPNKK